MSAFGTSARGVEEILKPRATHLTEAPVGKAKSISQIAHDLQVRQTQGKDLRILGEYVSEIFEQDLVLERLSRGNENAPTSHETDCCRIMSLKKWTAEVFINAGQKAYFGEALSYVNPTLPQTLMEFDELSWQVFYQYPTRLRGRLNKVSGEILHSLRKYLELPSEQRRGKAWFTAALEEEYRKADLSREDIACQMLFLYWGINTNISKVGFWMIAHILFTPGLADSIREEIEPAFRSDGSFDSNYTYSSCPRLNGLWLETLRVSATSTTVRTVTSDTTIGGKLLQKGKKLLVSARQLHFSRLDFGDDVGEFDPKRFITNPTLHRDLAFRPFGGGVTQCPGRLLAKHMVLSFISLLFHRFDVSLTVPQSLPKYQESKPAIGITAGDGDLDARLKKRAI
ncbi:MAG: hypothetical protein Q9217_005717 [Psora testacea]